MSQTLGNGSSGQEADASWLDLIETTKQLLQSKDMERAQLNALGALHIAESFQPDDRRQGISLELLTQILFLKKDYALCAPLLIRLLEMYKRCLGPNHLDTGTISQNAAQMYHTWGKIPEASHYYQEALKIKSLALGANHPDVMTLGAQVTELSEKKNATTISAVKAPTVGLTKTGQFSSFKRKPPPDEEFIL